MLLVLTSNFKHINESLIPLDLFLAIIHIYIYLYIYMCVSVLDICCWILMVEKRKCSYKACSSK